MSDSKLNSLGQVHEPQEVFVHLARLHGVVAPGEALPDNLQELLFSIVRLCADVADEYSNDEHGNAGEHIRSLYGQA